MLTFISGSLKSHLAYTHNGEVRPVKPKNDDKVHQCEHCEFNTTNKFYLRDHINAKHLHIKKYQCVRLFF